MKPPKTKKLLIVSAFWVEEQDLDTAMEACSKLSNGIKGSGSTVSFLSAKVVPEMRRDLRRFDLGEAADFRP